MDEAEVERGGGAGARASKGEGRAEEGHGDDPSHPPAGINLLCETCIMLYL